MSEEDYLTVFDIKYKEGMDRLDNLLSDDIKPNFIKNYVERYKLEKSLESRNIEKNDNRKNNQKDEKRKQIVNLNEIRKHEKKTQQYYNKNYLKNQIEWYKIKKREDEQKNKYNNNYYKQRYENDSEDISKEIIRNNKLKMKKFSNLANKVNIEKLQKKKLNKNNNINDDLMIDIKMDNNKNNDGIFIPYEKYKENEIMSYKNKNRINNLKQININTNKSENLKYHREINKPQKRINNHISQNINNNSNKDIKKKNYEKKTLKSKDNNRYNIDKRQPLDIKIDYLKKMENNNKDTKVKIYENKKLLKDKNNVSNNIELLNFHSKNYEDKAKRQEQLMRIKGNSNDRNEDNVKLSNYLIDSISTKLAILNQMSS